MDLRNVPCRNEVLSWSPDALSDYFKKLNFKDCEKVVKKNNISGQRFLSMSENDIQRFPKLKVPIISKLCQEINKKEEKRSLFRGRTQTQKVPDETEHKQEEAGWSSFEDDDEEEDDYESPDAGEPDDEGDYESPEDGVGPDSDGDYEPPPPNDETAHHGVIFPAKSNLGTSDYIDRPTQISSLHNPPAPPQRPAPVAVPPSSVSRPNHHLPCNNEDKRCFKPSKPPPPNIDRSTKPFLDRLAAQSVKNSPVPGKRSLPDKLLLPPVRPVLKDTSRIQKPPVPTDKNMAGPRMSSQSPRPPLPYDKRPDDEDCAGPQRTAFNSNTFPLRTPAKPSMKPNVGVSSIHAESFHTGGSLPPHSQQGNIGRSFSQMECVPSFSTRRARAESMDAENLLDEEWYVREISRPDAERALRMINEDGAYLVRNSSRKTISHPYVLMVLYSDKVYNVQIRYDQREEVYLLGTGGKEHFSSVAEIIDYFRRTPLLLIDGKDRDLRYQCKLTLAAQLV